MDNQNNEVKKIWFFQKIINWFLIFLWIIFLIWWLTMLSEWDYIYWFSSIIVWVSFFPYIYNKIKIFLAWKDFAKKILINYWKIYFFTFFLIFILWVSLSNSNERQIKEQSYLWIYYPINQEITDQENITINITQKYLDKININSENINFDKNQEAISQTIPLNLWENIVLIKWENDFYKKDFSKTITRLSQEEYKTYLDKLEEEKLQKEKEEQERFKKLEQERLEQEKVEKMNYTWIWAIWNYVDDFWDKTWETYITNNQTIKWTFSNTATQDSILNIDLLINDEKNINIMLYEYAWNNPIKSYWTDWYTINVRDKDWNKYNFRAKNTSDRLIITKLINTDLWAVDLHKILLKWWEIKFVITKDDFPSEYKFTIQNADWYDNIYRKKQESK